MSLPDPVHDRQFYDGVPLRRLVAFFLDLIVVAGLMMTVIVGGALVGLVTAGVGFLFAVVLFFISGFAYRYLMLARRSATLGMLAAGIELRDRSGQTLDPATALVHTAGFFITFSIPPVLLLGWVLMTASPYRRLMHDHLPGTAAINRPV